MGFSIKFDTESQDGPYIEGLQVIISEKKNVFYISED